MKCYECDVQELNKKLSKESINLIDVREYAEFSGGRIKGSKLIPLGDIERRYMEIDDSKPVYLICRTGRRSAEAQRKLAALGLSELVNVRGGIEDWKSAGFATEKDENAVWSLERQVRFAAGSFVLIGVLLGTFVWLPLVWIAGFIGAGLVFSAATDTCGMALVLSKLPWNRMQVSCEPKV